MGTLRINPAVWLVGLSLVLTGRAAAQAEEPNPAETPKPSSSQPEASLSLADLEQMALQNNPTLAQAAAIIEAARGKAVQAGLYPNPTIGYQGDQIGAAGTAGELQGAFIQQTIVTAGKLRLSRAKYTQEAYEAEVRALAQQMRVLNGVRLRYYELLAVQRMVELRRDLFRNAEESLRTYREMFNTGQANRPDVLLAEVEANRARIALRAEENRYWASWQELTAVLGLPTLPPTPLRGRLEPDGKPLDWEVALGQLLQESPEVQAAQAHVVRDQIALKREQVEPIPNLYISASTGRNFETSNTVAGVQVGVRVPLWDRNQGTIRQAKADLARSHAEIARVELSLRQRLAQVFGQYQTALETVQLYRDSSVPKATEAYEEQREMYRKRRAPWAAVVKAERDLFQVKSEYTQSLLELRRAEVAIAGMLLVDGLTEPPGPGTGGHLDATARPR